MVARFWVSWFETKPATFEYHGPWWVSGEREDDGALTMCAAVQADNGDAAKDVITMAHDEPRIALEWRFVSPRADDWAPFCERFSKAPWMRWPWPVEKGGDDG